MKKIFNEKLYSLSPYIPGDQPIGKIIKLNTNENPYPPSPKINSVVEKILKSGDLRKYPNPTSEKLRSIIAKHHGQGLKPENVLVTNGSDEALAIIFRATLKPNSNFVMPNPTYSLYTILAAIFRSAKRNYF